MDFTYFDVQLGDHKLPLNAAQLDEFIEKCQPHNGNDENEVEKKEVVMDSTFEDILDIFAQLKPFFLF